MTTRSLRPVDRLVAAVHFVLAAWWIAAWLRGTPAPLLVAAHAAGAVLFPRLLARLPRRPHAVVSVLRELYPMLVVVGTWTELGLIRSVRGGAFDAVVASLDLRVFGTHLQALWMPAMPQVAFSELMYTMYFLYYPAVFLTPALLLALGARRQARHVVAGLAAAFLVCFLSYVLFPVDGPSHTAVRYAGPLTQGFMYQLTANAIHAGDSLGTAFPSSHVVGAVTMAILAWRWLRRPVAWLFTVEAGGVVLSTVYTQNHYAIDALAGILLALVVASAWRPHRAAAPAWRPVLPAMEVTNE